MANWLKFSQKTGFLTDVVRKHPHPEGWGYTHEASGRGLKKKLGFDNWIWDDLNRKIPQK